MASRTVLSIAMGSAIAVAGLVGGTMVMASNDTSTTSGATTNVALDQAQSDAFLTALAGRLGKTVDELKTALQDTNLEFLDKALADSKITQEQHDKIKEAITSGRIQGFGIGRGFGDMGDHGKGMPFGKGPRGIGGGDILGQLMGMGDSVAKAAGVEDAAALRAELQSGKSLAEIAVAHGKSTDDLKAALKTEAGRLLATAVTSGKLTQTQADTILEQFKSHLDQMITMKMGGMGPGFHMGPKGNRPFGPMLPGTGSGTQLPTTNSQ